MPSIRAADAHVDARAAHVRLPVRLAFPALDGWLGACHVLEIPFVFGIHDAPHLAAFTGAGPAADRLSAQMMDAWVAFARSDDPSTPELAWPRHDTETRPTMYFADRSRVEHAPRDDERAVVDAHARLS